MRRRVLAAGVLGTIFLTTIETRADKVCLKVKPNRSLVTRTVSSSANCPRGYSAIINTAQLIGPTGPAGVAGPAGAAGATGATGATGSIGADGSLKVWGDGSGGALTLSASGNIDVTKQYTDVTINAGVVGDVPDGGIIRCTGTATINGQITVANGTASSRIRSRTSVNTLVPAIGSVNPGASQVSAGHPEIATPPGFAFGGFGGESFDTTDRLYNLRPRVGGGGGAGSPAYGTSSFGGAGGGAFGIYCKNGIRVSSSGIINSTGGTPSEGGGGGAGGLIVLASANTIVMEGSIFAAGSAGSDATARTGAGGGGSGGLVHYISPAVNLGSGNHLVNGGAGGNGAAAGSVSEGVYSGGGAGGALGGAGGAGGAVLTNQAAGTAQNGADGRVYSTVATDPTALLLQ